MRRPSSPSSRRLRRKLRNNIGKPATQGPTRKRVWASCMCRQATTALQSLAGNKALPLRFFRKGRACISRREATRKQQAHGWFVCRMAIPAGRGTCHAAATCRGEAAWGKQARSWFAPPRPPAMQAASVQGIALPRTSVRRRASSRHTKTGSSPRMPPVGRFGLWQPQACGSV